MDDNSVTLDTFSDADQISKWARNAVLWCRQNGILTGVEVENTVFAYPQKNITRAEAAKMLATQITVAGNHEWDITRTGNETTAKCTTCEYTLSKSFLTND